MNLFKTNFEKEKLHKNYVQILRPQQAKDRDEICRWSDGFPDRDNKLVDEFQTTFNSSFWEIYLYRLFKSCGALLDWGNASPDFDLQILSQKIIVEATIASNAQGKVPEWDKGMNGALPEQLEFRKMNVESIIRLANAFTSKHSKYKRDYVKKKHVIDKPFVLAISPFEQPNTQIQGDTPITSLLYDYYIDEDIYNQNIDDFPNGPPGISLGYVEKDNGSKIKLGVFEDDSFSDISAIIFSSTATWGKVEAMSNNFDVERHFASVWYNLEKQWPVQMSTPSILYSERIQDGLWVFHNPYANKPIDPEAFEISGITQVFANKETRKLTYQRNGNFLMHRKAITLLNKKS